MNERAQLLSSLTPSAFLFAFNVQMLLPTLHEYFRVSRCLVILANNQRDKVEIGKT